jgi:hypothetical protein
MKLPTRFGSVEELEDFMTEPTPELVADLAQAPGDILILGVAGKMGPTLARMAKRAAPERRVIGVARFSDPRSRAVLETRGSRPSLATSSIATRWRRCRAAPTWCSWPA